MKPLRAVLLAIVSGTFSLTPAYAQQNQQVHVFFAAPAPIPQLTLPATPSKLRKSTDMQLAKPDGDGPFPAMVFMPPCGGHGGLNAPEWAEAALKRGFVTLIVDPLTPRRVTNNCTPPIALHPVNLLQDAFDAADHLRKLPYVDKERIVLVGFSQGAMVGMAASDPIHYGRQGRSPFAAAVSFYPGCIFYNVPIAGGRKIDAVYMPRSIGTPLLVLMGAADTETEPEFCIPLFEEQKKTGAPIEWEVIAGATHGFDMPLYYRPSRKRDYRNIEHLYKYSPEAVAVAEARMFKFLEEKLQR